MISGKFRNTFMRTPCVGRMIPTISEPCEAKAKRAQQAAPLRRRRRRPEAKGRGAQRPDGSQDIGGNGCKGAASSAPTETTEKARNKWSGKQRPDGSRGIGRNGCSKRRPAEAMGKSQKQRGRGKQRRYIKILYKALVGGVDGAGFGVGGGDALALAA